MNYSPTLSTSFSISASLDQGPLSALNLSHYVLSLAYPFLSSTQSVLSPSHVSALLNTYSFDFTSHSLAYKPVAKKVRLVLAPLKEEYHVLSWLPVDPLAGLIPLLTNPPDFVPRQRFTQEPTDALDLNPTQWLWPEEVKLVWWMVLNHETAFAWTATKRSRLDDRYFPPVKIPTVPHTPWILQNIPIPPSSWDQAIQIIKVCTNCLPQHTSQAGSSNRTVRCFGSCMTFSPSMLSPSGILLSLPL